MNEKIHYDDFIEQIALESGYDNDTVRQYLSGMFETIVIESTKGNLVKLRNFGSFQPRWYKAKRGINPQTKQPLDILPHYHIHFASSKVLQNALNNEPPKPFLSKLILPSLAILVAALLWYFNTSTNEPVAVETVEQVQEAQTIVTIENEPVEPILEQLIEEEVVEEQVHEIIQEPEAIQEAKVIEEPEVVSEEPITSIKPSEIKLYPGSHTITTNESLSTIGSKIYGTKGYWPLLYSANTSKISNPDLILRGYSLVIPDKTDSKILYSSYLDVHNAYMQRDLMSKSFWILCEGSRFMGKDFKMYLKKKLPPSEYPIIEQCSPKGFN